MAGAIGFYNGDWKPVEKICWPLNDIGPAVGAIAVERLRTVGGRLPLVAEHYARLRRSAAEIGSELYWSLEQFITLTDQLLQNNETRLQQQGDVAVVSLISPGSKGEPPGRATQILYIEDLPWQKLQLYYKKGVKLFLSNVQNVSPKSWSPHAKVRCRLQYYLADLQAQPEFDLALLLCDRQHVTDTSIACALICLDDQIFVPPKASILSSVTQAFLTSLDIHPYSLQQKTLTVRELQLASEIILLGTTGKIHAVTILDLRLFSAEQPKLKGVQGPIYRHLKTALIQGFGFDFEQQANANVLRQNGLEC